MTKPITIPQSLPQGTALSYDYLYEEGLKAYLVFFEQLLANSFVQLAHFKD